MTTKKDLQGLTVNEIKNQYPNGQYKSSMKKDDVIAAALASAPKEKSAVADKHIER
jgi:hypothetical protein